MLPTSFILLLAASAVALGLNAWRARRSGISAESQLYAALWLGLLAARLAFVLKHYPAYLARPWDIINIRDGGWSPWAGLAVMWLYITLATLASRQRQKQAFIALAVGSTVWVGGNLALLWADASAAQTLPAWSATTLQNQPAPLHEVAQGKPVALNLWATWCPHCRREMPLLAKMQTAYPDVQFIFLNQGESAQTVARYLQAQDLPLQNVLLDARSHIGRHYGNPGLPYTLFFDAQGKLVSHRTGGWSQATLEQALARISP